MGSLSEIRNLPSMPALLPALQPGSVKPDEPIDRFACGRCEAAME